MEPEVKITIFKSGSFHNLICSMKIPEREDEFRELWNIQTTLKEENNFTVYKEICVLIGKSFERILQNIMVYEKYGIKGK